MIRNGREPDAEGIEKIDVLKERNRKTIKYMDWFRLVWAQLSDENK